MFIVQKRVDKVWTDWTSHSRTTDATNQLNLLVTNGLDAADLQITEKTTYSPPPGKTL